jgi:hypothetical protein
MIVAQHSTVLYSSTGMFGTDDVLRGLHKVFVHQSWVREDNGELAADFRPNGASEIHDGTARRLELVEIPQDAGETGSGLPANARTDPEGTSTGITRSPGTTGRGRRGVRFSSGILSQLTPQQADEFVSSTSERQQEIADMLQNDPTAVKAIQSGRPLSTIRYAKYVRRDQPLLTDFLKVGFCLWAMVIGYGGGCFARYVYARRTKASKN